MSQSHSTFAYRPDIDGLRAIAVFAVVLCHAGIGFPGGYVGVDVFFVISGYLITSLILKDLKQGEFSLMDFWERRIRRIFPALVAVTVATLVAGWFLLLPDAYGNLAKSVVALIFMVSNIYFWKNTNYFSPTAEELPLLHTWSLAVEEQFYLVIPIVLLWLGKKHRLRLALPLFSLVFVVSLGVSMYGVRNGNDSTFYFLPTRAWELLAGTCLAFGTDSGATIPPRLLNALSVVGMVLVLAPCFFYDQYTPFPGLAAIPPVLGSVLIIWSGTQAAKLPPMNQLLATRPVVFVGRISYSLYLWHWPLIALSRSQSISPLSLDLRLSLVGVSVLLAIASWRFVEEPFRRRQLFATKTSLVFSASLTLAGLLGTAVLLSVTNGMESRIPASVRSLSELSRVDEEYAYQLSTVDIPRNIPVFGEGTGSPQLLVWGDSHAMTLLPVVAALCREKGVRAAAVTHAATPPVLDYVPRAGLRARSRAFSAATLNYLETAGVKNVLLSARWEYHFEDPKFATALKDTIAELQRRHVNVYILSDFEFPYHVPKALALFNWRGWDRGKLGIDAEQANASREGYAAVFASLEKERVTILDTLPVFQPRESPNTIVPYDTAGVFYRDEHHLTRYGAMKLKPLLAPVFDALSQ
jgi:peptidoglycan/LPS O-acetylase OafA/YrhL